MCGIIAVLRRTSERTPPTPEQVLAALDLADGALALGQEGFRAAAAHVEAVDRSLRGVPGVVALVDGPDLFLQVERRISAIGAAVAAFEQALDAGELRLDPAELEDVNAAVVQLKDAVWAVRNDRLRSASAVAALAGDRQTGRAAIEALTSVQVALSGLDRLEVRGRDSAGLHLLVSGHGLDLSAPDVQELLCSRAADPLFTSGAVETPAGHLSFVYKAAAEIGELGDNGRTLRAAITADRLLHRALEADTAEVAVLGHTRWASVGIISQANAHPLNDREEGRTGPYVVAALNGDVDNYLDLRASEGLRIPPEITTDAKVIPMLVSRRMESGLPMEEAFRQTVGEFHGSVAIGSSSVATPDQLHLALKGSGQALYVGLAEDMFIVASEAYGLVEETPSYFRIDGETTGGQVVVLDRAGAGTVEGIRRISYGGHELPVEPDEIHRAEITTRDIDRAGYSHFLLKEISEAPNSFRKTLRGKIVEEGGRLSVRLSDDTLPPDVRAKLRDGDVRRILVIGQGTAAVAGQSLAAALRSALPASTPMSVTPLPATELSGFQLDDDMSDALVIAISQSGTTTDTNRTVDLVRGRGASVVSIVNRRNSDLVEKSDGVLYTSDGRDVEMSVASTKAFYAQVAAGFLLALGVAAEAGQADPHHTHELLAALRLLPDAMEEVLANREQIADAAARYAPSRRYWAVVGNGPNRIAAQELRIKLSELCYKSIACDATEDKKHIDLSSEPLILVCATGLTAANAGDVAKEVAIYRAHKASPIVIASEGASFPAALETITVRAVHPALAFVLSTVAGHLFGYEAALSIDAQARPLREARAAIESVVSETDGVDPLERLAPRVSVAAAPFFAGVRDGAYNGHLEAATAVELSSLLRTACGALPLEAYEAEHGKVGTPSALMEDLTVALTRGIEELTRPIDAIKHQAKTVTVGISRSEDALLRVPLVAELLASGAPRDRVNYRSLRTLSELDPAVVSVTGYTRYRIEGTVPSRGEPATIHVVDRGGVARDIPSRTDRDPVLKGTKHRAAEEREVTVALGARDGRSVILVPEIKGNQPTGLTLLHVQFAETADAETVRAVLSGYRNRYSALVDAVTETESAFDDAKLGQVPLITLLTQPVHVLAAHWR